MNDVNDVNDVNDDVYSCSLFHQGAVSLLLFTEGGCRMASDMGWVTVAARTLPSGRSDQ